jgi:DNA-directed RNA polymerase specialized sigma24 family protein
VTVDFDGLSADVHRAWLRGLLVDALAELPPDGRRAVQLLAVEGWEPAVAAEMMGRPEADVRALYEASLRTLRALLAPPG